MAYVLTDGASGVISYPYSIGSLRRDNPNVSYPAQPDNALLSEWNVYPVAGVPAPGFDRLTQNLAELNPVGANEGTSWTQAWVVTDISPAEAAARTAQAEAEAEAEAARLMQEIEQYYLDAMIAGHGFTAEMQQYVTELENYALLPNYPKLENMVWPRLPTTILDPANANLPVDIYTKQQVDAAIAGADTYTRAEVDALIAAAVQSLLVGTRSGDQINILN